MKKTIIRWRGVAVVALPLLSGCASEPYMLGIYGYNYTDRAVDSFSVNGAWGGDVLLSTPTSGGGGTTCCVVLHRNAKTPFWVEVEYRMDELVSYETREIIEPTGPFRTVKVEVKGPIPKKPSTLEIHFYPDGHIEGAISGYAEKSPPRLKLERRLPFIR